MADASTETNSLTLEESLNKTDFGHWLYEHRKSFIAAVVLVFIGASGWLLYKQYAKKQAQEHSAQVYQFEQGALKELRDGKLAPTDFVAKFSALDAAVKGSPSMLPHALEAAQLVDQKGQSAEAAQLLSQVVEQLGANSPFYVFVAFSYASLSEKAGQTDAAIKTLEDYVAQGHKVMLSKAYLDLGRLYLAKNDKAKAKTNFEYITSNYPNDELAKLAKLYLQKLSEQP